MTADRWRQIESLFSQALECPPAGRTNFLDQACRGDDQLRRELESLLNCDTPDQHLIQVPELSNLTLGVAGSGSDLTGRRFGPYRISTVIGHGGMGSVYLGLRDDDQYRKQVAIKILKRGMDTDSGLECTKGSDSLRRPAHEPHDDQDRLTPTNRCRFSTKLTPQLIW